MNPTKILVDLKPALDGYSGIPQESRLLFHNLLCHTEGMEVEGLIQHGGNFLSSPLTNNESGTPVNEKIIQQSNTVISLTNNTNPGLRARIKHVQNYISKLLSLRLQALKKKEEPLGYFNSNLFEDFLWRACFSKTLKPIAKKTVTKADYRVLRPPRGIMHAIGRKGITKFHKPRFLTLDTKGYDFFISQTPFPGRVSEGTQLVIRYHDSAPVFMPHTIEDRETHQAAHYNALKDNVESGALFSCISEATRTELIKLFPEVEPRSTVIYNAISDDYFIDDSDKKQIQQILSARRYSSEEFQPPPSVETTDAETDYLLCVATLEPRKNHELLVSAWEALRQQKHSQLKLVIVGNPGWDYEAILKRLNPWVTQGDIFYLTNVSSHELRALYHGARATICSSFAEGFDYSGIESMRCGCPVVASDIAVHKEIYGKAALYFDPYNLEETIQRVDQCIEKDNTQLREQLRSEAKTILARYNQENLASHWSNFFEENLNTISKQKSASKLTKANTA